MQHIWLPGNSRGRDAGLWYLDTQKWSCQCWTVVLWLKFVRSDDPYSFTGGL